MQNVRLKLAMGVWVTEINLSNLLPTYKERDNCTEILVQTSDGAIYRIGRKKCQAICGRFYLTNSNGEQKRIKKGVIDSLTLKKGEASPDLNLPEIAQIICVDIFRKWEGELPYSDFRDRFC